MQALFNLSKNFFLQYIFIYATDSGYKNKNISFYPKSLRTFLRILCVVDDYACGRSFSALAITLIYALVQFY